MIGNGLQATFGNLFDSAIVSMFNPPDVDAKFIKTYNIGASIFRNNAKVWTAASGWAGGKLAEASRASARFFRALGTPIDTEKDIWGGLDYEIVRNTGKNRLISVRGKMDNNFYFVPPEAGHNSGVVHYQPRLSKSVVLNGLQYGNVWINDKLKARPEHSDFGLENCVELSEDNIRYIHKKTGKKVHVVGFCQGGWEAGAAAYLSKRYVASFAAGASPFNWHSKDLSDLTRNINPANPKHSDKVARQERLTEKLIERNDGVMPGLWNLAGFVHFSQDQLLEKDIEDLRRAAENNDRKRIDRFIAFRPGWFFLPQGMSGTYFLDIFRELYRDNNLFEGRVRFSGRSVDFGKFDLPIYCLNGYDRSEKNPAKRQKDNITSLGQQMDLFGKIVTPASHMVSDEVAAGHIGVFNSSRSMPKWNAWFRTVTHKDFGKKEFDAGEFYRKALKR